MQIAGCDTLLFRKFACHCSCVPPDGSVTSTRVPLRLQYG